MILVAGSANLDFVLRVAHVPAAGETVLGRDLQSFPGGKGANQALACARAGAANTHMVLALGEDAAAGVIEASLRDAGVTLHLVRTADVATGTAFICVQDGGDNAIAVAPGANAALLPEHLPPAEVLRGFSHLLLQLETPLPTVLAYAQAARAAGVRVVLNAAPAQPLPAAILAALDVLIVNEGELATLAGPVASSDVDPESTLGVPAVVVTLGERGCRAAWHGQRLRQSAFAVPVVDTTAAGDTFCGAFVAELGRGSDVAAALRQASAAAALACTQAGAQSSIPQREAVMRLLTASAPEPPASNQPGA